MSTPLYLHTVKSFTRTLFSYRQPLVIASLAILISATGFAQTPNLLSQTARQQIAVLLHEKAERSPAQQKMNTQLIFANRQRTQGFINAAVPQLQVALKYEKDGRVKVDIDAIVKTLLEATL